MKRLKWLLILAVIAGAVIYKPEILRRPDWIERVQAFKRQWVKQPVIKPPLQLLSIGNTARQQVLGLYTQAVKDQKIPGLPKEVSVNTVVDDLTERIKGLPEAELKQVKTAFCRDVIDEATESAK